MLAVQGKTTEKKAKTTRRGKKKAEPVDMGSKNALLVVTDLANDKFDIEPIADKKASTITDAFDSIVKRHLVDIGKKTVSIRTDSGKEFNNKLFRSYLATGQVPAEQLL